MNIDVELNRVNTPAVRATALAPVFALALFTSAALLFWVQPLVAKMLLPLLGGAPSVWNTCMVFFQALLLAGYAYALLLSQRLSLKNQAILHAVLLLVAGLVLPFTLSNRVLASLPTQSSPIVWLLTTLLVTVGPPFLLLSATAPLLQRWFSHSTHKAARDPYFLYAVSNAGSMLALLGFPFLLEPAFAVRTQNWIWAIGYAVLAVLVISCAILLNGRRAATDHDATVRADEPVVKVKSAQRFEWVLLAFVPSTLMLGVTTFIATDVASVPLIWIIPLALYLLTFIIAFGNKQLIKLPVTSTLFAVALLVLGALVIMSPPISVWVTISLHLLVFFLAALVSHQRLAQSRPHVSKLPEYFLWIAVGGVLGGIFNAILAPLLFSTPVEYPVAIILALLVRPVTAEEEKTRSWWRITFPTFIFVLTFGLAVILSRFEWPGKIENALVLLLPFVLCFVLSFRRPIVFALGLAAFMFAAIPYLNSSVTTLATERNFFGVWRVTTNPNEEFRRLYHGSTVHGVQLNDPARKCEPTSYYHKDGPLGQVFAVYNSKPAVKPVAATGLGAGTIGTYAAQGQEWDFYDIDPAIVRIASDSRFFTFLSDCTKATYRMVLGDARLRLREAPSGKYGLLVMDAFSSDSVPAHLLTTEAMDLYLDKLSMDGVLAFHISNRYLNLEPLLSGLSRRAGLVAYIRRDDEHNVVGRYPSVWVVMARHDSALGTMAKDDRWHPVQGDIVWTDDFSNILSLLK
ncbi:MAG TPA: fused MFS/spermidine synthase [Pyrinomonadaceae bacterium]|nr:fused MFS/spermidine synthase [Pyrinomonadaceae bacterium]